MPSLSPAEHKTRLRRHWRQRRREVSAALRKTASQRICSRILNAPAYGEATHVAGFLALPDEVDIKPLLLQAIEAGKQVWLPRVEGQQMTFAAFDPAAPLERAAVGTLQPGADTTRLPPQKLDLVLMPLLAFTRSGWRLGMGGGFYDRAFSFMLQARPQGTPTVAGIAFSEQEAECLPHDPWDVPMHHVATQKEWIDCA